MVSDKPGSTVEQSGVVLDVFVEEEEEEEEDGKGRMQDLRCSQRCCWTFRCSVTLHNIIRRRIVVISSSGIQKELLALPLQVKEVQSSETSV